jgi:phosphoenolpyruvate carboxykinase (ATP)
MGEMGWEMERLRSVLDGVLALQGRENVKRISPDDLERICTRMGTRTEFGNYNFSSSVRNRSASRTVYIGTEGVMQSPLDYDRKEILDGLDRTLDEVFEYLRDAPLLQVDLTMGENRMFSPRCHLYLSNYRKDHSRLALMASRAFFPDRETGGPDLYLIDLPEWHENKRQILVFPEVQVTIVLGSDYYGEVKKGFLRMGMYCAKRQGMLGLHAGTKTVRAMRKDGVCNIGMVLFGLTATGKTTHTCHDHGLTGEGEVVRVLQDDVVFLCMDGHALGTEMGFYIKTDGLDPQHQPLLYEAAKMPGAILENVAVDHLGTVRFQDLTLTGNGRGIVHRDSLGRFTPKIIDLPSLKDMDRLFMIFITRRNTILPIISKLDAAQAAGAFMLGESVESSGGDPRRAGESVRVVGTNPFIIGSETEEGNWFHEFLQRNGDRVECYLLNTGGVGEVMEKDENGHKHVVRKVTRVDIDEVAAIIRGISRDTISWKREDAFGTLVPEGVEGIDLSRLDPRRFYSEDEIQEMVIALRNERAVHLSRFSGLAPAVIDAYRI